MASHAAAAALWCRECGCGSCCRSGSGGRCAPGVAVAERGSGGVAAAAADALAASLRVKGGEGEEGEEVADEPYDFNEAFAAGNGDEGHSSGADEEMGG